MYSTKYRIVKIEEFNRHNPIYDDVEGHICYPAYLNVGERGWFLHEDPDDLFGYPHRIHTSIVKDVTYTRGNQIVVTTQNTRFTFEVISRRETTDVGDE